MLFAGVSGFEPKLILVPAGIPEAERLIGVEYPKNEIAPRVITDVEGPLQVTLFATGESKSKSGSVPEIVKLVFEISKKIFPTASTFILAVVEGVLGMVTVSEPSFAVLAINTIGKVNPPSVDRDIFTLAQLTGAIVVLATSHVIVCVVVAGQETFVLGEVTWNGPEAALTVTTISVNCVWPTLTGAVEL